MNITAPELDLGAQLITLPSSLLSAESQLQERCTALLEGDFSSFISIGRGGTEPAPEELQSTFCDPLLARRITAGVMGRNPACSFARR